MTIASLFDQKRKLAVRRAVSHDEQLPSVKKAGPILNAPIIEGPSQSGREQAGENPLQLAVPPVQTPQPQPAPPAQTLATPTPAPPAQPQHAPPAMLPPIPQSRHNLVYRYAPNPRQLKADLLDAIFKGDDKKAAEAIAKGADVNLPDSDGITPLMVASKYGYPAIIWMLKGFRADVNAQDKLGRTALMYAVLKQQPKSASMLIQSGADTSIADNDGRTPAHAAILKQDHGMLQLLLEAEAPVDVWDNNHETPLIAAIQADASELNPLLVKEILAREPDLSTKDGQGYTALIHAIKSKNPKLVSMVLQAGADPNQAGLSGAKPLEYAKTEGTIQIRMQVYWYGGR